MGDVAKQDGGSISLLVWLGLIGASAAAVVFGLYVYEFHEPGMGIKLSDAQSNWNNFGTFFGGVLGPFFGFMALVGVLLTLQNQSQQQEESRKREALNVLFTLLDKRADKVEQLLEQVLPDTHGMMHNTVDGKAPLSEYLSLISHSPRKLNAGGGSYSFVDPNVESTFQFLHMRIHRMAGELAYLAIMVKRWRESGGDSELEKSLQRQFTIPIANFHALGYSGSERLFVEAFPGIENAIRDNRKFRVEEA